VLTPRAYGEVQGEGRKRMADRLLGPIAAKNVRLPTRRWQQLAP